MVLFSEERCSDADEGDTLLQNPNQSTLFIVCSLVDSCGWRIVDTVIYIDCEASLVAEVDDQ